MKKVITYGSFDLFHEGHYNLLKRAKDLGDYLIVGVTTEHYDESRGKLNVIDSIMERIENVKKTGFVDEVVIEDHEGQKLEDIQKHEVDIFVVGSDWTGVFDYLNAYCKVVYLERTKNISSTLIRQKYDILRLGIIGNGRIARRFVPEAKYVSGMNVEGVFNPNAKSAEQFADKFSLNFFTDNLRKFFEKIDLVYIASPHGTHYDYIKESLNNGKHILCEKPLVLSRAQAEEVFKIAREKKLILFEAIKTAYCPAFSKVTAIVKSGRIGQIKDVEAAFTKLTADKARELKSDGFGGSFIELASYPLLAIVKILGTNYKSVRFESFVNKEGVDIYTKAYLRYENAIATAKVGLKVKSEGELIASGTNGYLFVKAPWWKTQDFELRYENQGQNEKHFHKFYGDGLRYEISDFVASILGNGSKNFKLLIGESVAIAGIMEAFIKGEGVERIEE
jgi:glycerol-3-phosphate cytidylyltransferase